MPQRVLLKPVAALAAGLGQDIDHVFSRRDFGEACQGHEFTTVVIGVCCNSFGQCERIVDDLLGLFGLGRHQHFIEEN